MRIVQSFDAVKLTAHRSGACVVCDVTVKRSKTFRQTINPYNRNAAGDVKTRQEIRAELEEQARNWDWPQYHEKCEHLLRGTL